MTKKEFLEGLKSALGNNLSGPVIQENVDYYNSYISEEIKRGRSEEEVTAELGDPWVIARTIADSVEGQDNIGYQEGNSETSRSSYGGQRSEDGGSFVLKPVSKWKVFLVVLGIIGIFMVIAAVVGGIISLLAPILVPVIIVVIVIRALGNRRK